MNVEFPDDFSRIVRIHGDRDDALALAEWLAALSADRTDPAHGRFHGTRRLGKPKNGFDEFVVVKGAPDGDGMVRGLAVPLLVGWPMAGTTRPPMGALGVDELLSIATRIRADVADAQPLPADPAAVARSADRDVAMAVAALLACDHPDDADELVHEDGSRRHEVVADRFTGLPDVRIVDRHYCDDDIMPGSLLPEADLAAVASSHVLHLRLGRTIVPGKGERFRIDRLDPDDAPVIHAVVPGIVETMRILAAIRHGATTETRPSSHDATEDHPCAATPSPRP